MKCSRKVDRRTAPLALRMAGLCLLVGAIPFTAYAENPTFVARATVDLCQEAITGSGTVMIQYAAGSDPTLHTAEIVRSELNPPARTGVFDIKLPASFGKEPIRVVATCVTRGGASPSNAMSLSNCDALARSDSDGDTLPDNTEDLDCDNRYLIGDVSSASLVDSDGDGVSDAEELAAGTIPSNAGIAPRMFIAKGGMFDPDGDGEANAVSWSRNFARWNVKNFSTFTNVPFGSPGDIPFTYSPVTRRSGDPEMDFGTVTPYTDQYLWSFHGAGFVNSSGERVFQLRFGTFGDQIMIGPWEGANFTSPAVARFVEGGWHFVIYQRNGTIRELVLGTRGDLPRPLDYDGDGLFDAAVFRPSEGKTYIVRSSDGAPQSFDFGALDTLFGDVTGDRLGDIVSYKSESGRLEVVMSEGGFYSPSTFAKLPGFYFELGLPANSSTRPLHWNVLRGKTVLTLIDHANGMRFYREGNNPAAPVSTFSWGETGDAQG